MEANSQTNVRRIRRIFNDNFQFWVQCENELVKWISHQLPEEQKLQRLEVCLSHETRNNRRLFLNKIITCDEK